MARWKEPAQLTGAVRPSWSAYSSMLKVVTCFSEICCSLIIRAAMVNCGTGPTGRISTRPVPASRAAVMRPTMSSANSW